MRSNDDRPPLRPELKILRKATKEEIEKAKKFLARADYHRLRGDEKKALYWATRYLKLGVPVREENGDVK